MKDNVRLVFREATATTDNFNNFEQVRVLFRDLARLPDCRKQVTWTRDSVEELWLSVAVSHCVRKLSHGGLHGAFSTQALAALQLG